MALLGLAAIAAASFSSCSSPASTAKASSPATSSVSDSVIETSLRLAGTTEAVRSRPILAPELAGAQIGSMVVTFLAPAGSRVKQGDLLVEFDRQAQLKDFLDKQATYRNFIDQVTEKQAAEDAARAKDDTELQQAKDELKKAQLEMQKNEVVSRIDAEINQETLTEARSNLKQLEQTYQLKRQAAAADIRTLEIQRDRAKATMDYAQSNARKMSIRSPMDGVLVLNTIWLGGRMGEVQEGDQIRPGVPFMRVVDPSQMDVRVEVNQADILKLKLDQKAEVHLDAYPGLSFPGTLEEIDPLGHTGQFSDTVRTFTAIFSIQGSDPKLMPDLSAAVDVDLRSAPGQNAMGVSGGEEETSPKSK